MADRIRPQVSITLRQSLLERLDDHAKMTGKERSRIIDDAVEQYLDREERKRRRDEKNSSKGD